jgi:hypothetical protein
MTIKDRILQFLQKENNLLTAIPLTVLVSTLITIGT